MILKELLARSAAQTPEALAVSAPDGKITYGELDRLANRLARTLAGLGVGKGDRVGIWLEKSVKTVAAMQAALRLGAAYVPLDPLAPAARIRLIVGNCQMKAVVTTRNRAQSVLTDELADIPAVCVDEAWQGPSWTDVLALSADPLPEPDVTENDLAYILYTSGSTGIPKGVCISQLNALAFVEWVGDEMQTTAADRLANHAPFHFDLSVLDLYVAFRHGASVHLIPDSLSYSPKKLVEFVLRENITIWYSVPSVLTLMMDEGGFLELPSIPLRVINFAGEPFPIRKLRPLWERWGGTARFLNLYGPTETNVCTYYEVKEIEPDRIKPVPIGVACSGDRVWAVKEDGATAGVGEEGELMCEGPTVLMGYWGKDPHGQKPYATGDVVRLREDGNYEYIGRRDHMVKVRGNRVELGDIEAVLAQHPDISEAAVVVSGSGLDAHLIAFAVSRADPPPGLLAIKRHCAERLPRYMIVHDVRYLEALPRTRNGKVDRLTLTREAAPPGN